jgi:serine/threonine-protein kinase
VPVSKDQLESGQRLGDFEIIREIGRGGMGSVYLAEETRLRRKVALKVILPELADQPDFRRRFEAEARGAAAIEHPNIVPVHTAGLLDGRLYLEMRFIDGINLNQALESRGPLEPSEATRILAEVAAALDAAHAGGLVHRDVTPANILLEGATGSGGVYLTDFGLVRGLDSGETQLTRTDQVIANLDSAAPEQIQGGRVDARTDVYALGCVLYRMRSGERPFSGTDTQKMWKIVNDPVPSIGSGRDPFDPVIARATAKDSARRFPSAGDLARAAAEPATTTRRLPECSVATGPAAAGYFEAPDGRSTQEATEAFPSSEPSTRVLPLAPAGAKPSKSRVIAITVGGLALLAGVAVAAVLIAGGNGGSSRTVVRETVTAPAADQHEVAPTTSEAQVNEESQRSTNEPSARATSLPGLEEFIGVAYRGLAPSGWDHELIDKRVTDYYENVWHEPADAENTFIRIDGGNRVSSESPFAASEGLVEEVRQDPEYREISYGPDYKYGREAARWIYELDGDKRADYFFVACNRGLASVGSTTPGRYPELAAMFREVAFSTEVICGE